MINKRIYFFRFFIFVLIINFSFLLNIPISFGAVVSGQLFFPPSDDIPSSRVVDHVVLNQDNENPTNNFISQNGFSNNTALGIFSMLAVTGGIIASAGSSRHHINIPKEMQQQTVLYAATYGQKVLKSEDLGETWEDTGSGLPTVMEYIMSVNHDGNNILFAATYQNGVYKSTDYGKSWKAANVGLTTFNAKLTAYLVNADGDLYLATEDGVYKSTNYGGSWFAVNNGLNSVNAKRVKALMYVKNVGLFAGTWNGVYKSTDGGASWTQEGISGKVIWEFTAANGNVFYAAVDNDQVYKSIDGGNTWTKPANNGCPNRVYSLQHVGSIVYVGTVNGVFRSIDEGANWTSVSSGDIPVSSTIRHISNIENLLFAGILSGGLYSAPIDDDTNWTERLNNTYDAENVISVQVPISSL